jgi:hypothetical protein
VRIGVHFQEVGMIRIVGHRIGTRTRPASDGEWSVVNATGG